MKKISALVLTAVMALSLVACGGEADDQKEPESKYLTEAQWADLNNYMFAVEVEDYENDNYKAGTYRFYPSAVDYDDPHKTPIVWDVYTSSEYKPKKSQLTEDEFLGCVGGITAEEITVELKPNTYVYVIYNDMVGEPSGMLNIEKQ